MAKHESDKAYTVLARRYRPQDFAAVVGQEAVARSLANAITAGRVAHAYLFKSKTRQTNSPLPSNVRPFRSPARTA